MQIASEILTERLRCRPPLETDAEEIFARYSQDSEVCLYLSWKPHRSVDDTLAYLRQKSTDGSIDTIARYLIFSRESDQLLGSIGGRVQSARLEFGYCLARDAWGYGYATEAARAFVETFVREPSIWRIQAFCDVQNFASARVLQKIGLTFEGTLRRYMMLPNLGEIPRDVHCYAKVRE